MGALQPWHLIIILAVVLIIFGAGKIGDIGGAMGKSVKEFKQSVKDEDGTAIDASAEPPTVGAGRSPRATSSVSRPTTEASRVDDV